MLWSDRAAGSVGAGLVVFVCLSYWRVEAISHQEAALGGPYRQSIPAWKKQQII